MRRSPVVSRSAWRIRWAGRVPRAAFTTLVVILSFVGLLTMLAGSPGPVRLREAEHGRDLAAESFAEGFTRAYLSWNAAHPERHEKNVSAFTSDALEPGAGLSVPAKGAQQVTWTATVRDEAVSRRRRLITVAAETSSGSHYYLSVSVQRDRRGLMAISRYPALVGAPPVDTKADAVDEPEVGDGQLRAIARRAITNYLRGEGENLRADLDSDAVVALPPSSLRVTSISAINWARPRRVAIELRAEARGTAWTLRYELDVVKRERWYVRSIQINPKEGRAP
jgi:hypothetical protein